jgi:hypothetical protein
MDLKEHQIATNGISLRRFGDSPPWYEVAHCLLELRSPSRLQ